MVNLAINCVIMVANIKCHVVRVIAIGVLIVIRQWESKENTYDILEMVSI